MEFQSLLSDREFVDCSLWCEYSSANSSCDLPSSPCSASSVSSSLLGEDNSFCDVSTLIGSNLITLENGVRNSTLCQSAGDVTSSESNDSVNAYHWMDLQQTTQYQTAPLQGVLLNPYQSNSESNEGEWFSENKLSSCCDFSEAMTTDCTPQCSKPKRRRVQSKTQRKAANVRERKRMVYLNDAFDSLRKVLPAFSYEKNMSRIETLKLAIKYIGFMKDVTDSDGK